MIDLLVTLAVFSLAGAATTAALRIPLPASKLARCAFFFLTGLGANGAILYLLGTCGVPLRWTTMAAIPLLAAIVVGLRWRSFASLALPHERHAIAGVVFALPLITLLCAAAVIPTRDYDGRVTWLPKARAITIDGATDGPFFQGKRGLNLHNRYPLLMPLNAAVVMASSGNTQNETTRWLYALTAAAALIVLRGMLISWYGGTGAWTAAAVAWLPVLSSIEGGAIAAYNDFAIAAFFGIAVLYAMASTSERDALRAVGLFAAFALLTKNEGATIAIAVFLATAAGRRLKSLHDWAWVTLPIVAAELLVLVWRLRVPAAYDERYESLVSALPVSMPRLPAAVRALAIHAIEFNEWGIFWIAVAVATTVALFVERSARLIVPLVAIIAALGAYTLALTVTSWQIEELANVAANRLLSHALLPAACIVAMTIHRGVANEVTRLPKA